MKLIYTLSLIFLIFSINNGFSQNDDVWTLDRCIDQAWESSLQIKQSDISIEQTSWNQKQAKHNRYPSVSGSISYALNFGRSINLTNYEYVNQNVGSSQLSLDGNLVLYSGGRINKTIKQSKIDVERVNLDKEQTKNDIALSIAQAYLNILLTEANLEVLEEQILLSRAQYNRTLKLIDAGSLPDNNRYDLEAQLALDTQNIVIAKNNIELAYVSLKVLMNIDPAKEIKLKHYSMDIPLDMQSNSLEEVYQEALNTQANIKAASLNEESMKLGVDIAKSSYFPTLSAFYRFGSNYSSASQRFSGDTIFSYQDIPIEIGGIPTTISFPQAFPSTEYYPYFAQIKDNFFQNVGLSLNIPIYNNNRSRVQTEQAKLSVTMAEISTAQLKYQLKSDIARAITDVESAFKTMQASERTVISTRISVENTQKRYDLGVVNSFEMVSVRNRLLSAESSLLQAKYDYVFKLKVLDYYRGRPITLE